jgi:hypothetical protein
MAKKAKGFGVNSHTASNKRKRPGRHSKKHKRRKKSERGQGYPSFRLDKRIIKRLYTIV